MAREGTSGSSVHGFHVNRLAAVGSKRAISSAEGRPCAESSKGSAGVKSPQRG